MNDLSDIKLDVMLGVMIATPAPAYVTESLERVEVTRNADGASTFQLHFHADRTTGASEDFALLAGGLLDAWNRVVLSVRIGGLPTILIDGFITHQELVHDRQFGAATLTVSGEDVSIVMDRVEMSLEYPQMGDDVIVRAVLEKYALIGIVPDVADTPVALTPLLIERTPQQNATDRDYLRQLAGPYGYRFTVTPGPEPMMNRAYWGPPLGTGTVARALSVDLGSATNVDKISFQLDALAPVQVYGMVQDNVLEIDGPVASIVSTRSPPLAEHPAFQALGLMQRRNLFTDPRYGFVQAMVDAQSRTSMSTDCVVTGQGELDTLRYGSVLEAPGLVDVRGVGRTYDGRYRVDTVTHTLARGSYRQAFTLHREGTGSTISRVTP